MSVNFKWGDVCQNNTRVGDKVIYITSPARGNSRLSREHYSLVEIIGFGKQRVHIRFLLGHETYVNGNHLFKIDSLESKIFTINDRAKTKKAKILVDSVRVTRDEKGMYKTLALNIETGEEEVLGSFSGPGKMKKAKEFANSIKGKNIKSG